MCRKPSRFVTEVPPALYDIWSLEEDKPPPQLAENEPRGLGLIQSRKITTGHLA